MYFLVQNMKLRRTFPPPPSVMYSTRVPPLGNDMRETCKIRTLVLHLLVCRFAAQLLRQWAHVITYNRFQQLNSGNQRQSNESLVLSST